MAIKTIICLSFIVLNHFFANMCEKNCASPTKSLTARHCLQHNVRSSAFFSILDRKKSKKFAKADIYQYYNQNRTKLSSMYIIALLTEKMSESTTKAQQVLKTLGRNSTSAKFQNKKLKRNATSTFADVALCASNCAVSTYVKQQCVHAACRYNIVCRCKFAYYF